MSDGEKLNLDSIIGRLLEGKRLVLGRALCGSERLECPGGTESRGRASGGPCPLSDLPLPLPALECPTLPPPHQRLFSGRQGALDRREGVPRISSSGFTSPIWPGGERNRIELCIARSRRLGVFSHALRGMKWLRSALLISLPCSQI